MRGLLLFMGECFREGISCSRINDTLESLEKQKESSLSHSKLISHLKRTCHVDIVINTVKTVNEDLLLSYYDNVIYKHFNEIPYLSLNDSIASSIRACTPYMNDYDFLFICRLDILLKDSLIEIFDPTWKTITFPNVMYIDKGMNFPHIADLFCFIPKKYFTPFDSWAGIMKNTDHLMGHHSVRGLIQNGLTFIDIGYFTDKIYIANTFQMKNPLYAINSRSEGPSYVKGFSDLKYIKEQHRIVDSSGNSYICKDGVIVIE